MAAALSPGVYAVDKLLKRRRRHGQVEYLVRWAGYGRDNDSWEPRASFSQNWRVLREANALDGAAQQQDAQALRTTQQQRRATKRELNLEATVADEMRILTEIYVYFYNAFVVRCLVLVALVATALSQMAKMRWLCVRWRRETPQLATLASVYGILSTVVCNYSAVINTVPIRLLQESLRY